MGALTTHSKTLLRLSVSTLGTKPLDNVYGTGRVAEQRGLRGLGREVSAWGPFQWLTRAPASVHAIQREERP